MLVGLISDTHGLIRPAALAALAGAELILHAGDVGGETVIAALRALAPVEAVFGNMDPLDGSLPGRLRLTLDGLSVHVSHGHELGSPTPGKLLNEYSANVLIYGHTHRPLIEEHGSRLVVNPGAAGPRRFDLKPSVALLHIVDGRATAEIVPLSV
jgi:putative phosphoesterase